MACKAQTILKRPFFYILLFILGTTTLNAEAVDITIQPKEDSLSVTMVLIDNMQPEIIESLDSGLRSEISFEIKIYRRTSGFRSIFGDRLIREEHVIYEGSRDSFSNNYLLSSDSATMSFSNPDIFLERFYRLDDFTIPFRPVSNEEYYVLGRIVVEETKLVPPLNLLTPFMHKNRTVTAWYQREVTLSGGHST